VVISATTKERAKASNVSYLVTLSEWEEFFLLNEAPIPTANEERYGTFGKAARIGDLQKQIRRMLKWGNAVPVDSLSPLFLLVIEKVWRW